jgi:two-component system response regulator RpfG
LNALRKSAGSAPPPGNVAAYEQARRLSVLRRRRQVVIVDDETTGRAILERVIQRVDEDLQIISFETARAALQWLQRHRADLIITDFRMPDLDGIEFIRRLRELECCQTVPVMMITVVTERRVRHEALEAGATAFLTRPIDPIECGTSCRNLLKLQEQQSIIQDKADWLARQVDLATRQIIAREHETLLRLARAGEYRDEETGNHVFRMARYARLIAEELGLSAEECEDIEYSAPMHDIGKIGIPDEILLKPGSFEPAQWERMKQHTVIGHNILSNSDSRYMKMGAVIALNHHEKYDGSGYPSGLSGEEIPLVARIVAVADVFDALMSERPYKQAWPMEKALELLRNESGRHFDPQCVDAFFSRIEDVQRIREEFSDD